MKKLLILTALLFTYSISTLAQNYGLGNAPLNLFKDFRIPTTKTFSYALGGMVNYSSSASDFEYHGLNSESSQFNFSGRLNPTAFYRFDSEDYLLGFQSSLEGTYSKSKSESIGDSYNSESENDNKYLVISSALDLKKYFSSTSEFFYSSAADINIELAEQGQKPGFTNNDYIITNGYKHQQYKFSIGFGKGRQRNVTPVISAIRFQERMKQLNLIDFDLETAQINKLAEKFAESGFYSSAYERASKHFWGDIDKILTESGISTNHLNAYAQNYLQEVPNELRFIRYEGWYLNLQFSLQYSNIYDLRHIYNNGNPIKSTSIHEDLFFLPGISFDYKHQLNLQSQFGLQASFKAGPNLSGMRYVRQQYIADLLLSYNYELTDRLVTSLFNAWNYTISNTNSSDKYFQISLQTITYYFIEDNINLNLNLSYNFRDNRTSINNYITTRHGFNLSFGLNYFFDRGILF